MPKNLTQNFPLNFAFYPLFWLAIFFAAGLVTAKFLLFGWNFYAILSGAAAILTIYFRRGKYAVPLLCAAFAALGALYFQTANQPLAPDRLRRVYDENRIASDDPIEIEGVINSAPELAVSGFFINLQSERAIYKGNYLNVSGEIKLFAAVRDETAADEYRRLNLKNGAKIRVAVNLQRENNFQNPGVPPATEILDQQGTDATGVIKSPLLIEKIGEIETFAALTAVENFRRELIIAYQKTFDVSTSGILIASQLGNDNFLDRRTAQIFRDGGTFHVLVISGLHITFIGGLLMLLMRFWTKNRWRQLLVVAAFLWIYTLMVGANLPVVRATLMFTILLFSQALNRRGTLLNAFGLCGLILLAWRPNDIFTASFQLTFASVGGIILTAFPLIERLRAVGNWSPSAEKPFPPRVSATLKKFCETLYWREQVWEIESARHQWTISIFKSPFWKWNAAKNRQKLCGYIFEMLIVSLVVQIWLLPLLIVYFHRLALASVVLNLWVGTTLAIESFVALAAISLVQISDSLALPFVKLTELLNWLLVAVPEFFVADGRAVRRIPQYAGAFKLIYGLYFAPLIYLTAALNRWQPFALKPAQRRTKIEIFSAVKLRFAVCCALLLWALIIFHPFSAPLADNRLHVDFLDVGQGDAALVTFPNGETMLVDGGGVMDFKKILVQSDFADEPEIFKADSSTIGERVVSNYLWNLGYSQIDYLLATHADADHIKGLTDIAANFRVRAAFFGRTPPQNAEFANLARILQERGIESRTLSRGDTLPFGAARVQVLYPEKDTDTVKDSDNNQSLVVSIDLGNRKFLLTGDIERETENYLLSAPAFLQADVVKVAHHGSRTSSTAEFINATQAAVAVISVGKNSPFGHPHSEVVERWKNAGAKVLTTGENGTISVSTDGKDLRLETFVKPETDR